MKYMYTVDSARVLELCLNLTTILCFYKEHAGFLNYNFTFRTPSFFHMYTGCLVTSV